MSSREIAAVIGVDQKTVVKRSPCVWGIFLRRAGETSADGFDPGDRWGIFLRRRGGARGRRGGRALM